MRHHRNDKNAWEKVEIEIQYLFAVKHDTEHQIVCISFLSCRCCPLFLAPHFIPVFCCCCPVITSHSSRRHLSVCVERYTICFSFHMKLRNVARNLSALELMVSNWISSAAIYTIGELSGGIILDLTTSGHMAKDATANKIFEFEWQDIRSWNGVYAK